MTEQSKAIQEKVTVLELAKKLGNVSKACKMVGYSRDSYYRFKKLYERGGEAALQEVSRRRPILKNRVAPEVEEAVVALALQHPRWGQAKIARELSSRGVSVSPAGVRCIWLRHGMQRAELRLKTLTPPPSQTVFPYEIPFTDLTSAEPEQLLQAQAG